MHHAGVRLPRLAGRPQCGGLRGRGRLQDPTEALAQFREEEGLTYTLVSDEDLSVQQLYGAWGKKNLYGKEVLGSIRSTVVVNPDGVVELAVYNVKATGHVGRLRRDLGIA